MRRYNGHSGYPPERTRCARLRIVRDVCSERLGGAANRWRNCGRAQQKRPTVPHTAKQRRLPEFDEYLLENVARVVFLAGEIEQEHEQGLRVFVIKPPISVPGGMICLP